VRTVVVAFRVRAVWFGRRSANTYEVFPFSLLRPDRIIHFTFSLTSEFVTEIGEVVLEAEVCSSWATTKKIHLILLVPDHSYRPSQQAASSSPA